jgi:hypothetical protein
MPTPWSRANTDWFHDAKFGLITHFLADTASNRTAIALSPDDWNRRVDGINVERVAQQIADTGAKYQMLTLGQNSGFFCAPNDTYDRIVGAPESRLSKRDLMADLGRELVRRGVRPMAYMPSHAPALHREAVEAFGFTPSWDYSATGLAPGTYLSAPGVDDRLTKALQNWEAVIREWSTRWGSMVGGWWVDGCYFADKLYRHADAPNFQSFAEAAKSGNAESLIAFNPGVKSPVISMTEYEDYTAGELNEPFLGNKWHKQSRYVEGAQFHVLIYNGEWWGEGPLRFSDDLAASFSRHIVDHDGVITWDVPITQNLEMLDECRRQLEKIGQAVR